MAIKRQFGGQTLRKPGAYSKSQVSQDSGAATTATGVLFLIGEADAGPSGADEGVQEFSAAAFNRLVAKYRSGAIVDAAKAALTPSRTPGVNGAGKFLVYKTNPSTQASYALANTYDTVKAREYGVGGKRITYKNTLSSESEVAVTGSATVTNFAGLDGLTLVLRVNGGAATTVTFSSPANLAAVISQIDAAVSDVTSSSASGKLKITLDAASNQHRNGWGRSLEVVSGTALTDLFLTAQLATPADEAQASLECIQPRDNVTSRATVGGTIALEIGRDASDSCTAATVTIDSDSVELTATGSDNYSLAFTDYPLIGQLVDAIDALAGWSATCPASMRMQPTATLDQVSSVGAYSATYKPARIKRDAQEVSDFFSNSPIVELDGTPTKGLPDAEGPVNLTGGTRGASTNSHFTSGFEAALAKEFNVALPCISQDASDDITAGITDAASTYDVETVQALLSSHLELRGNIKNKKEAQGFVGYRKSTKAAAFAQAATVGSALIQLCMQDVLVVDSTNTLTWKQPHIMAALMAGIRLGTSIGEPLTHKFLACNGTAHYANTSTGKAQGDFDPLLDYDDAIDAGVTFAEPAQGGFRIVLDNTTYGADESFVWNRGSVVEAAQYIAKTVRTDAELAFIGKKTSVIDATSVKSRVRSRMLDLFNDGITSASEDAPQGFVEETFIVEVNGNTAEVQIECKPVQGLDFVLITFTLGESRTSA